jgi:sugar lactone lactonase YvrE
LVAALSHSVVACDVATGDVQVLATLVDEPSTNRFNDGAVDASGRFWFGSMDLAEAEPNGVFYSFDSSQVVKSSFAGIICSNGPAWSPDGATMYHVDSTRRRITAYEFDVAEGVVGRGRLFVSDEEHPWYPDGVTVDAEGFVWNAKWGGGRVVRYSPDGEVDRILELPVPRPTRCAFVGADLDQLAITSARTGLTASELAEAPLSGHTLLVDPYVRGRPAPRYQG